MRAALAYFDKDQPVKGHVYFEQENAYKPTYIWVCIRSGLKPGQAHAFHVHEYGDSRNGCTSMGNHYNPFKKPHGSWVFHDSERHVGDLLNNLPHADLNGGTQVRFSDALVTLFGNYSVYGCSIVIHEGEDDLGMGGTEKSLSTGNAGPRLACTPIVRCEPDPSLKF